MIFVVFIDGLLQYCITGTLPVLLQLAA